MIYSEITDLTDGPVQYEKVDRGHLKMVGHQFPLSILEKEFNYITDKIIEKDCKLGFEVATAFGISGLAAGLGFKQTNGKLLTIDAYIEESNNDPIAYQSATKSLFNEADGFKSVNFLIEKFGLKDNMIAEVGWSPNDIEPLLLKHFGPTFELDYIFIDSGHFKQQFIEEIRTLSKYTKKDALVIFHDAYDYMIDEEVHGIIMECFGGRIEIIYTMPDGENLGVVVR